MISDAVGSERISAVVGYKIKKGDFSNTTPNLPQRILIIGEANTANQINLNLDPFEAVNAQEVGTRYGYGSPLYHVMRILKPLNGGGIGGIPVVIIPQEEAVGATSKIIELVPTGVATANGKHTVIINGRRGLDLVAYDFNVVIGDTTDTINDKIADAINNVLGTPVTATATDYEVTFETKWKGLTANDLTITVDNNGNDLGITYSLTNVQSGAGTPDLSTLDDKIGNEWTTLVVNTYTDSSVMDTLEAINGVPDPDNPTGRYAAIVMKPFVALTGYCGSDFTNDIVPFTTAHRDQVTISFCPAPNSSGFPFEAAANYCALEARQAQDTPHLDISGKYLPDMPVPTDLNIGEMSSYDFRDFYVQKGISTVDLVSGRYKVMDFVTTYHPVGETPPQFRYVRNLMIDFNVRFGYYLLEQINVVDHALANDNDITNASKVVKPKQWKGILFGYADDLVNRSLIADAGFTKESITVGISSTNPDRFETKFKYKRTGFVRIASTTAEAGFNFGTNI
jgi:phage tail sheath gpL-like